MAKPPPPRRGPAPETGGPIHKVPCPYCGHKLDFRELKVAEGETLYRGAEVSCEACNMMSVVVLVQPITFVKIRPTGKKAPIEPPPGGLVRR